MAAKRRPVELGLLLVGEFVALSKWVLMVLLMVLLMVRTLCTYLS